MGLWYISSKNREKDEEKERLKNQVSDPFRKNTESKEKAESIIQTPQKSVMTNNSQPDDASIIKTPEDGKRKSNIKQNANKWYVTESRDKDGVIRHNFESEEARRSRIGDEAVDTGHDRYAFAHAFEQTDEDQSLFDRYKQLKASDKQDREYKRKVAQTHEKRKQEQWDKKLEDLTEEETDLLDQYNSPFTHDRPYTTEEKKIAKHQGVDLDAIEKRSKEEVKDDFMSRTGMSEDEFKLYAQYRDVAKNAEEREARNKETEEQLKDKSVAGMLFSGENIASVLGNDFGGVPAVIETGRQLIEDRDRIDTSHYRFGMANQSRDYREAVSNELESRYGKGASFAYQTGMSVVDSALMMPLKEVGLGMMGTSAAVNALENAQNRGLDRNHALATAAVAGAAEVITEKVSLDKFFEVLNNKGVRSLRKWIAQLATTMGVEGSEETASDVINAIGDAVINGDQSEYNQSIDAYMKNGATEKEAKKQATIDFATNAALSFAGGAIAGGVHGGIALTGNRILTTAQANEMFKEGNYAEFADSIDDSRETYQNDGDWKAAKEAKQMASDLAKKSENGERITSNDRTKLLDLINETTEGARRAQEPKEEKFIDKLAKRFDKLVDGHNERVGQRTDNVEQSTDIEPQNENQNVEVAPVQSYQTKPTSITADEAATRMSQARSAEELGEIYNEAKNSSDEGARREAESQYQIHAGRLQQAGVSPEALRQGRITQQEAYEAGQRGEDIGRLSPKQLEAYNQGALDRQNAEAGLKAGETKAHTNDGANIEVSKVVDTNEGKIETTDGQILPMNAIHFDSKGTQKLYNEAMEFHSPETAQIFIEAYPSGMPVNSYSKYAKRFYNAGQLGVQSFEDVLQKNGIVIKNGMSEDAARSLFEAGQKKEQGSRREESRPEKVRKAKGRIIDERTNKDDKSISRIAKGIADKLGVDIKLTDQMESHINGQFSQSAAEVVLNTNNDKVWQTMIHECMGEFTEAWNESGMSEIQDEILNWWLDGDEGAERLDKVIKKYQSAYEQQEGSKSYREAANELVNDALAGLFSTPEGIEDFTNWATSNLKNNVQTQTVLERIANYIKELIDTLKNYIANHTELSDASRSTLQMEADRAAGLRARILEAADKARENYQEAEKTDEVADEKERYSLTAEDAQKYLKSGARKNINREEAFKEGKRIIAESKNDIKEFLKGSEKYASTIAYGRVGKKLAKEVLEKSDKKVDIENYYLELEQSHKIHAINNHVETNNGNNASMSLDEMVDAVWDINNAIVDRVIVYNSGERKIELTLVRPNGEIFIVETASKSTGGIKLRNIWKKRNRSNSAGSNTPDTVRDDPVLNPSITPKSKNATTNSGETHNSLSIDSEGRELSEGQQEYFKDSKIRNDEGDLMRVYHGTEADFTVFDSSKGRSNMDIQGMFFSPWELDAQGYGSNVQSYYLNITNPAPEGLAYKTLNSFKGQNNAGVKARKRLIAMGYDGVNNGDEEFIAFYPEQIKRTDNENPTEDPDIRYSLSIGDEIYDISGDGKTAINENGREVPVIKLDGITLGKKKANAAAQSEVRKILKELRGKTTYIKSDNRKVFFDKKFEKEYAMSRSTFNLGKDERTAKYNAATRMVEIISNAQNPRWNEDVDNKHGASARRGWTYYDVEFIVNVEPGVYADVTGRLCIRMSEDGRDVVYDVDSIKIEPVSTSTTSPWKRTLSDSSISSTSQNATTIYGKNDGIRHSLSGIDSDILSDPIGHSIDTDDYMDSFLAMTAEEIDEMYEETLIDDTSSGSYVEYRGNIDKTVGNLSRMLEAANAPLKGHKVNRDRITAIADQIKENYSSHISRQVLTDNLVTVFDYLQNNDNIDYNDVTRLLTEIAAPILEKTDTDIPEEYVRFKDSIRGYKIKLTDKQKQELAYMYGSYEAARKANFGRINFSDDGQWLDELWSELSVKSAGLLDGDAYETEQPTLLIDALNICSQGHSQTEIERGQDLSEASIDLAMEIMEEYYKAEAEAIKNEAISGALESGMAGEAAKKAIDQARSKMKEQQEAFRKKTKEEYETRIKNLESQLGNVDYYKALADHNEMVIKYEGQKSRAEIRRLTEQLAKKNQQLKIQAKALNKNSIEDYKESQELAKTKKNITRLGNNLMNRILNPTKKKHVPTDLQKPLAEFLSGIDFVSHRSKEDSKNTKTWREKMQSLSMYLSQMESGKIEDDVDFLSVLDPDLNSNIRDFISETDGYAKVSQLDAKKLKDLEKILKQIQAAINKVDTSLANEQYERVSDLAVATKIELGDKRAKKNTYEFIEKTRDFFGIAELDPTSYFSEMGSAAYSIFKSLRDGFDMRVWHLKAVQDYVEDLKKEIGVKDFAAWRKESHTFETREGEIELTNAQIMSLYCLMNRDQAREHIVRGGLKADFWQEGVLKKSKEQLKPVHITPEEYLEIINTLTDDQKYIAHKLQQYMATECAKWGNHVSKKLYGYEKFTEKNYFPIKVDRNTTASNDKNTSENASLWAIRNIGAAQDLTPHAKNAVIISDIFSVFTQHATDMATYDGLVLPLTDAMRWFNFRAVNETFDESNEYGKKNNEWNIKREIQRVLGIPGQQYFTKLIKDINGMSSTDGIGVIGKFMGNYKAAAVAANMRVVVQQPTAYARAFAEMDARDLVAALASNPAKYAKKAQENCAIALWKSWGFYETYMGQSMEQILTGDSSVLEKIRDVAGIGAQKADDWTWGVLWRACEVETMRTHPELEYDSKEFIKAVADRMSYVVDRTQVVDSVLHRSDLMRRQDGLAKTFTAFMAEPTKSYNMLHRAFVGGDKKKIGKALAAFVTANLLTAAFAAVIDAARHDDDEHTLAELWLEAFGKNARDNLMPFNLFPLVKDIYASIESVIEGGYQSSNTDMSLAGFTQTIQAMGNIYKYLRSAVDPSKEYSGKKTPYGLVRDLTRGVSQITGIPAYNLWRDIEAAHNVFFDNWQITSGGKYEAVYKAFDKDKDYEAEIKKLIDAGTDPSKIQAQLTSRYKPEYLALDEADRPAMKEKLLKAYAAVGKDYDKNIDKWVSDAEKDTEESQTEETAGSSQTTRQTAENNSQNEEVAPVQEYPPSEYLGVYDAIDNGGNVQAEVQSMIDSGKKKSGVKSAITRHYKDDYLAATGSDKANLKNALIRAYTAAGYSRDEAIATIEGW